MDPSWTPVPCVHEITFFFMRETGFHWRYQFREGLVGGSLGKVGIDTCCAAHSSTDPMRIKNIIYIYYIYKEQGKVFTFGLRHRARKETRVCPKIPLIHPLLRLGFTFLGLGGRLFDPSERDD
jgi:hypothetical protein